MGRWLDVRESQRAVVRLCWYGNGCVCALLVVCVLQLGCLSLLPAADLADLAAVLADPAAFAQDGSDVLADTPAGTVVDSLDGLGGCWAGTLERAAPGVKASVGAYQVLRFDATAGTLTRYTVNDLGGFQVLDVWQGDYQVVDAGRLSFQVRQVSSNVPGFTTLTDISDRFATLPSYEVRLTLDGDRLKAVFAPPPDDPSTPAGFLDNLELVHQRIDCAP